MAANRILKDWTESDKVNTLSANAEVFFTRLIMKADDYGVFHGNPKLLKANLFPLKDAMRDTDITRWIIECSTAGLILVYKVSEREYVQIINFGQRLRSMRSKYPLPIDGEVLTNDSNKPPEVEEKGSKKKEVEEEAESGEMPQAQTQEEYEFDKFCKTIPQVMKLSSPLTINEFEKLKKEFTEGAVMDILLQMENKKDLLKKYTSANLTARNWLNNNRLKQKQTTTPTGKVGHIVSSMKDQMEKRGLNG